MYLRNDARMNREFVPFRQNEALSSEISFPVRAWSHAGQDTRLPPAPEPLVAYKLRAFRNQDDVRSFSARLIRSALSNSRWVGFMHDNISFGARRDEARARKWSGVVR